MEGNKITWLAEESVFVNGSWQFNIRECQPSVRFSQDRQLIHDWPASPAQSQPEGTSHLTGCQLILSEGFGRHNAAEVWSYTAFPKNIVGELIKKLFIFNISRSRASRCSLSPRQNLLLGEDFRQWEAIEQATPLTLNTIKIWLWPYLLWAL